jgi:hypothetical protein
MELKELKAHSLLLGTCTSCPMLKSDLEDCSIEIKEFKQTLDHSSRYKIFSLPCEVCGTFNGKLLHTVDVSYAALQVHGIVNVALHQEYSPSIVFIFSQGRKYLYHV